MLALVIGEVAADVVNSGGSTALMQQRSYIAAVVPVIDESDALVPWLTEVRRHPGELGRTGLFAALGRLEAGTTEIEAELRSVGIPSPSVHSAHLIERVFSLRQKAARSLAGGITAALTGSSAEARSRLGAAARELRGSDAAYAGFISSLPPRAKRHGVRLPKSSWVSSASWSTTALSHYLAFLADDNALRVHNDLSILDISLEPPVLRITPTTTTTTTTTSTTTTTTSTTTTTTTLAGSPTSSLPATTSSTTSSTSTSTTTTTLQVPPSNSTSVLAPTKQLTVVVVVANGGDVAEHAVVVKAVLTPVRRIGGGAGTGSKKKKKGPAPLPAPESVRHRIGTFAAGASRDLNLPVLKVSEGIVYELRVSISGQPSGRGMSDRQSVRIEIAS